MKSVNEPIFSLHSSAWLSIATGPEDELEKADQGSLKTKVNNRWQTQFI
jgi:hypothetical protein